MNSNQRQEKRRADTRGVVGQIARIREQANLLIEEELRSRSMTGLLPAHGSVLSYLFGQREPVAIKEVVKHVGRVKSTVTGMLNTLEQHGYVRRTPSDTDRRVTYVELTEKGRALKPDFDRISERLIRRLYGSMPQRDRETLLRLLCELEQNLRRVE
jgi:DNA-binding MarR family transcriptional regulator